MKLLIYAANLHVGGGVQVAASIIDELSRLDHDDELTVWASSEIDLALASTKTKKTTFASYEVVNHFGIKARWALERHEVSRFDRVLVIFGPHYLGRISVPHAVGFAQAWIIYKNSETYRLLRVGERLLLRAKYYLQECLFKQSDMLIVELKHVRDGLIKNNVLPENRIRIVHNCLSSIFLKPDLWKPLELPEQLKSYRLGFLGRNYAHKNTKIFPEVLKQLESVHSLSVEMLVTFTDEEWGECSPAFKASITNVGPLELTQCPGFFQSLDGLLFPTLLECFSATPLEAMSMLCPIFVSDRPFMRDVCEEHAEYFDPTSPKNIAAIVAAYLHKPRDEERLQRAKQYAISFSSPQARATGYLRSVKDAVSH